MARVPLIVSPEGLSPQQEEAFAWIVENRGRMLRPFEVLLHTPSIALSVAELGAKVRFESKLPDEIRELAILTAGKSLGCGFVWDSHLGVARSAGVRPEALAILDGESGELDPEEAALVSLVRQLCREAAVSDESFEWARDRFGDDGAVELAATVGYYAMLGFVMGAAGAC